MSTVHVLVGQCGNQLGAAFLDALAEEAAQSGDESYQMLVSSTHFRPAIQSRSRSTYGRESSSFASGDRQPRGVSSPDTARMQDTDTTSVSGRGLPQPRCVMVDMEPKVIQETMYRVRDRQQEHGRALYSLAQEQCVTRGEGSGSNWAYGYLSQGASRREEIEECLRREYEMKDSTVSACHVLHSVAGGTGSGVSCVVADVVRDCFPRTSLLHTIVWPFECGEVVTQWYNAVLCMSALSQSIDSGFIAFNDHLANDLQLQGASRGVSRLDQVSFDAMNARIAHLLTPLHLPQLLYSVPSPAEDITRNRIQNSTNTWYDQQRRKQAQERPQALRSAGVEDIIETLSLDPQMKFFSGCAVPDRATPSTTWSAVLGDAARVCRETFTIDGVFIGGIPSNAASKRALPFYGSGRSSLWCLRGRDARTEGIDELRHVMATSSFAPFPLTQLHVSPLCQPRHSAFSQTSAVTTSHPTHEVTLYGAIPAIGEYLTTTLQRTETLLSTGAFLHHFERYGVTKDDIQDAVACLWDTASAYSTPDGVVS